MKRDKHVASVGIVHVLNARISHRCLGVLAFYSSSIAAMCEHIMRQRTGECASSVRGAAIKALMSRPCPYFVLAEN